MSVERIYKIDALLRQNRCVSARRFLDELEVSLATLKRDIEYMRSRLHAPIVWDREQRGYSLKPDGDDVGPRYRLPGIWLDATETHALQVLLATGGDPDSAVIAPLRARLAAFPGMVSL